MRKLLHILTRPDDKLAGDMITRQKADGKNEVVVADLTGLEPDYKSLVQSIFAADAVEVW